MSAHVRKLKPVRAAKLADVGREAGVSAMAASAVLNAAQTSGRIAPDTRERILEAAMKLNYRLNAAGIRVLDDVSVVGLDDSLLTHTMVPRLTTVRQPFRAMGGRAVEEMVGRIGCENTSGVRPRARPSYFRSCWCCAPSLLRRGLNASCRERGNPAIAARSMRRKPTMEVNR